MIHLPEYTEKVVNGIQNLQTIKIPDHLISAPDDSFGGEEPTGKEVLYPTSTGSEFDPNAYFGVLRHIALPNEYCLGYTYSRTEMDGCPCLCICKKSTRHIYTILRSPFWQNKLEIIQLDGSPESFIDLVIFLNLAGQFYIYGHPHYCDVHIIATAEDLENLIKISEHKPVFFKPFSEEWKDEARKLFSVPIVEMTDDIVKVTYCIFRQWGGFSRIRDSIHRTPPNLRFKHETEAELHYDCGIRF
jgi:hypothetical protein